MTLTGRTCVFAGATGRIGRAAVKAMAKAGMHVVMVTHDPKSAEEIICACRDLPGRVTAESNTEGNARIYQKTMEAYGSVDVILCTIGGLKRPRPLEALSPEELDKKLHHQIAEPFAMAMEALPYVKKSRAGRLLFLSSAGAQNGFAGEDPLEAIAGGGVISMTYVLANRLAKEGITVNCIARSGMTEDHPPVTPEDYHSEAVLPRIPLGRLGTPEDFAAAVCYLASEEAGFVTGQVLQLSGGLQLGS